MTDSAARLKIQALLLSVVALFVAFQGLRGLFSDEYHCDCPDYFRAIETVLDWSPATYAGASIRFDTRSDIDANRPTANIRLDSPEAQHVVERLEGRLAQLGFEPRFDNGRTRYSDGWYTVVMVASPEFENVRMAITGPADPARLARSFDGAG